MRAIGRVQAVQDETAGSELAAQASSGAQTLSLESVDWADETGGSVTIGTDSRLYDSVDYDLSTLHITAGTSQIWPEGTEVTIPNPTTVRWVEVMIEGQADEDGGEPLVARVPNILRDRFPLGTREPASGEWVLVVDDGEGYYVQDLPGTELVIDGTYLDPDTVPISDGNPPSSSPTPIVDGGISYLAARWTGVSNADPVTYEVHLSVTSGFTPSGSTLAGEVAGTMFFIRKMPDGEPLQYFQADGITPQVYYVKLIAKDEDGSAAAGSQASGSLVQVNSPDLVVDSILAEHILAGSITAEKLAGSMILTNELIAGDPENQHVKVSGQGVQLFNEDEETGTALVDLPTEAGKPATFTGEINATDLSVEDEATLSGLVTINRGGNVVLASKVTKPTTAPAVTQSVPGSDFDATAGDNTGIRRSLGWDGTYYYYLANIGGAGATYLRRVTTSGVLQDSTALDLGDCEWIDSIVKIGSYWYGLGINLLYKVRRMTWADSGGAPSGAPTTGAWNEWEWTTASHLGMVASDGTDLYTVQEQNGTNRWIFQRYTVSGTTWTPVSSFVGTAYVDDSPGCYYIGSGDFGVTRHVVSEYSDPALGVYSTAGTLISSSSWLSPENVLGGLTYQGGRFRALSTSSTKIKNFVAWDDNAGTATTRYWYAYSWNDADATGGTHETALSPRSSIDHYSRWRVKVSWPTIPDAGGTDDPDSVNIYGKQAGADPGTSFASYWEQAMAQAGTSENLDAYLTATAGSQDTAFPAATSPGYIAAADNGFKVGGAGELTLPKGAGSSPVSGAEGMTYYDTADDGVYVHNGTAWHHGKPFIGARLTRDTGTPTHTATGAWEQVGFSTQDYDTGPDAAGRVGLVSTTDNNFKIPAGLDGVWTFRAHVEFAANATGNRRGIRIVKTTSKSVDLRHNVNNAVIGVGTEWTGVCAAADVITVEAWQNSGGNLDYTVGGDGMWFEGEYKGPLASL